MYDLWKDKRITFPSEYWNASEGDKLVIKAFHDYEIEEKNEKRKEFVKNKIQVFPVTVV